MAADLVVGVDVGTTTLKAGLFDLNGSGLALEETEYSIDRPQPEWAEQDPATWERALGDAVAGILEGQAESAAAICLCGQVNTHVFVDADLRPLRAAILWQDQRCAEVAGELNVRADDTAGPWRIDASSLVARAEWVRRHEPDVWDKTAYVLSPKDYLASQLCQVIHPVTDPISPIGLIGRDGGYDEEVLALVDGLVEKMPRLEALDSPIGLAKGAGLSALADSVVVTGTMDAWGNKYGSGVVDHGQAMEVAGTSEILGVLSRQAESTPGVVTFMPVDGLYFHAGPTQAGGAALRWFADAVNLSIGGVLEAAANAPAGAGGLIFLPHLLGERAPLWDNEVRGAFIGLSSEHGLPHLARAVLEGVAFSARHLLEELERAAATDVATLNASGGGSRSDLWCQIKADVLDRQLVRMRVRHSGCLGAAILAASGADLVKTLNEAARAMVSAESSFEPTGERALHDELYQVYRDLYRALAPTHEQLAEFRNRHEHGEPTSHEQGEPTSKEESSV